MGMFDSFYDEHRNEWQTKALGRSLARWRIGDEMPVTFDCQMEGIGRDHPGVPEVAYATVRQGVLVAVGKVRDEGLPLIPYGGLGAKLYSDWMKESGPGV